MEKDTTNNFIYFLSFLLCIYITKIILYTDFEESFNSETITSGKLRKKINDI